MYRWNFKIIYMNTTFFQEFLQQRLKLTRSIKLFSILSVLSGAVGAGMLIVLVLFYIGKLNLDWDTSILHCPMILFLLFASIFSILVSRNEGKITRLEVGEDLAISLSHLCKKHFPETTIGESLTTNMRFSSTTISFSELCNLGEDNFGEVGVQYVGEETGVFPPGLYLVANVYKRNNEKYRFLYQDRIRVS